MRRKARPYWTCRRCGFRNLREHVNCRGESCEARRPKRPVKAHMVTLRDEGYDHYCGIAATIHGVADESCCACGKPRSQDRRHDRDHDHRTGNARGLLCGGNTGCNPLLLPYMDAKVTRAIADAMSPGKERERFYALAEYLERVEQYYAREAA